MADQPADGCAAENELDDGQPEQPPGEHDRQEVPDRHGPAGRLPGPPTDGRQMQQRPEHDAQGEHAALGVDVPHLAEGILGDGLDNVLEAPQDDPRSAEGQEHVRGQQTAGRHAEEGCADPLHQREVDRCRAIDAIEGRVEPIVELQQFVAGQPLLRSPEVGEFELVAGDRVADAAERDEAPLHDRVEEFVYELRAGGLLHQKPGRQAGRLDCRLEPRPQRRAGGNVGRLHRSRQQSRSDEPHPFRQVERGEPGGGVERMPMNQHQPLAGERHRQRPPAGGEQPAQQLRAKALPLRIDADLLEIVEQPCLRGPRRAPRLLDEVVDECLRIGESRGVEIEGPAKPSGKGIDLPVEPTGRRSSGVWPRRRRPPLIERGADEVALESGAIGLPAEGGRPRPEPGGPARGSRCVAASRLVPGLGLGIEHRRQGAVEKIFCVDERREPLGHRIRIVQRRKPDRDGCR